MTDRAGKWHRITALASASRERSLTPVEKAGVRFHLLMCGPCRAFVHNLKVIEQAAHQFNGQNNKS